MIETLEQEVKFDEYCATCEYANLEESEEPCAECLDNPIKLYSQKPVNWKEQEG